MEEKIFRVRMYSGYKGGSNYYHHADILETHYMKALTAAHQGRVCNWRRVDSFDTAQEDYVKYEYLGMVNFDESRNPMRPLEDII